MTRQICSWTYSKASMIATIVSTDLTSQIHIQWIRFLDLARPTSQIQSSQPLHATTPSHRQTDQHKHKRSKTKPARDPYALIQHKGKRSKNKKKEITAEPRNTKRKESKRNKSEKRNIITGHRLCNAQPAAQTHTALDEHIPSRQSKNRAPVPALHPTGRGELARFATRRTAARGIYDTSDSGRAIGCVVCTVLVLSA